MLTAAQRTRVALVVTGFVMIVAALWVRLLWLQVICPDHWVSIARRQHVQIVELHPVRGAILDRNLKPLAVSLRLTSVFADPRHIKNPSATAAGLAPVLHQPVEKVRAELARKERGFVWLARKIPNHSAAQIRALKLGGIHWVMEPQRFYPNGQLGSHLIGFAGLDMQGLEGLELVCNSFLKGEPGWRWLSRDARQRPVGAWDMAVAKPRDGLDVVLTVDRTIQYFAEKALDRFVQQYRPKGACILVLDPRTGEILAMANRPTFDPNRFTEADPEQRRNRVVTDLFEPGSVFKVVTAAVALGTKSVRPEDTFYCENGQYQVAGRLLHDHTSHGTLTFQDVIAQSSNIGVVKVAMQIGAEPIYRGIRAFGFGEPTGVEFTGELGGTVKPPSQWSKPSITTIPMGHEVTVNAMQLAQMISVVANGGLLVHPWIIREIRDPASGQAVRTFKPRIGRRVITREVARQLQEILVRVVTDGTGKLAQVSGFQAAGKTGTAQKLEPNGQYSHSRYVASFAGFVPVEDPRLSIVVVMDEPRFPYFGGTVSAPVFQRVAADTLSYFRQRGSLVVANRHEPQESASR